MNRSLSLIFVVFLAIATGQACKKKSNSTPTANTPFMKATIGDSTFSVSGISLAYSGSSSSSGMEYLYIYGKTTYDKTIQFSLINFTNAPGKVVLGTGSGSAYFYPTGFGGSYTYAVSGTITFTSVTPNLEGTFSFLCADSTNVTNGSFSVATP